MSIIVIIIPTIIGIFSTGILLMPASDIGIITVLGFSVVISVFLILFRKKIFLSKEYSHAYLSSLPFALISARLLMKLFYHKWLPSNRAAMLAGRLGLTTRTFLIIAAVILGLFSAVFLVIIFIRIKVFLTDRFGSYKWRGRSVKCFMIIVIVALQYVMLEYSALSELNGFMKRSISVTLVNIWVVLAFNLLIVLIIAVCGA